MELFGISLAKHISGIKIKASDISKEALKIANENLDRLLKTKNIEFVQSDMFENIEGKFDVIASNPPYIKTDVIKEYKLKYEPILALDGGEDRT